MLRSFLLLILTASMLLGGCAVSRKSSDPGGMLGAPLGGPPQYVLQGSPAAMLGLPAYALPNDETGMETPGEDTP
ncbi:MAG: hypothetical protein ACOCWR_03000 [Oceanidesulfovibrio sp.]